MADKLCVCFGRNTVLLLLPRFEFVFFSATQTVLWLISSKYPNSTNLSANNLIVQRLYPSGAGLQVNAIRCASCSPSSFRFVGRSGCGRRLSASSRPCSKKRRRRRQMVASPTPNAAFTCSFDQLGPCWPLSILSKTSACLI